MSDSKGDKDIQHGYYLITLFADSDDAFVEAKFLTKGNGVDIENSVRKIRRRQGVIVRDYFSKTAAGVKTNTVTIEAAEIIDSVDRSYLGNCVVVNVTRPVETGKTVKSSWLKSVEKWVKDQLKKLQISVKPLDYECGFAKSTIEYGVKIIDPPHQLPICNGRTLRVHGIRPLHVGKQRNVIVRVHDLKLGEFSYNANCVVIHGVDLRVQGNKINLNGNALHVEGFKRKWDKAHRESSEDAEFVLIVKGSAMRIDGVRADNIEAIRISDDCELKAVIEEPSKKEVKKETNRATLKSIGYSFKFFILLGALVWLTFLPFCKEGYFREKYDELIRRFPAPVVEVMKKPAELLNKICIQVSSSGGDANQVATTTNAHPTTESSEAKQENTTNGAGGGVVTFYFVLACLLYVVLYAIVVLVAIASFKAMRRHNKMTRNMSSVIEALRNERDKEKRREMQKKILDDMINTYLERPSSED